jgi:hypothetical protein
MKCDPQPIELPLELPFPLEPTPWGLKRKINLNNNMKNKKEIYHESISPLFVFEQVIVASNKFS